MNKKISLLLIVLSSLLYGLYFVISKYIITQGGNPLAVAFAIAVALTFYVLLAQIVNKKSRLEIKKISWKKITPLLIVGIAVAGISPLLLYSGQKITSATNSAFIFQLAPFFAALLGVIFIKEKLKKFFWISLVIILLGLFLLTTQGGLTHPNFGDILILIVAFLFGLYNIVAKKYSANISPLTLSNLRIFFGNIFVFIVVLFILGYSSFAVLISFPILIFINALFIYFYVFSIHIGIKNIGASNTAALFTITALFSAVFAFLFIGEFLSLIQYLGGALMIIGLILLMKKGI